MRHYQRSHTCGVLTEKEIGTHVTLMGWVHRRRDHGGLIFIDLRDRFGLTQVVFDPRDGEETHEAAGHLRSEWVIRVEGEVIPRSEGMTNPKLHTGAIEIRATKLTILSKAKTPPFSISDDRIDVNEELRGTYRYLEMRRDRLMDRLILRHKAMQVIRRFLSTQEFIEVTTPLLAKSTPEGARDYLVPSRVFPGSFYALPQSPQLFKQLLMIGGMDRYFQIASCFRDEDLRADRQPEFTQIDMELSFCDEQTFFPLMEEMMKELFKECLGIDIETPFAQMSYSNAVDIYGTDKPDLRFGMPLITLTDLAEKSEFTVFKEQIKSGGIVKGLCLKGGGALSRKQIEELTAFVGKFGPKGLAWMKVTEEGLISNIVKFFNEELQKEILHRTGGEIGDILLFIADQPKQTNQAGDHLRRYLAKEFKLIDEKKFAFSWIVDFPLLGWDAENGRFECEHHPFTAPLDEDLSLLDTEPLRARSTSYDLVLNGFELGSGSRRIHDSELQDKIFSLLQLSEEDRKERFGFFTEALKYGTPPSLGIGLGFDRIVMLMAGCDSIKEVIAFPKTQKASDLMTEAPSPVLKEQLSDLKIHVELE
jgi:aspartyl-tRNA synthetase